MPDLPPRLELGLERTDGWVLERGGGRGALATALMGRVEGYLAVERSGSAVEATRSRLGLLETSTRWTLHHGTLDTVPAARSSTHLAVAVNVNLFWTGRARGELDRLTELLTPAGCLVLVYEVPGGATDRLLGPLAASPAWSVSTLPDLPDEPAPSKA